MDEILNFAKLKGDQQLKKQQSGKKKSRLLGIPKLDDANCAGNLSKVSTTTQVTCYSRRKRFRAVYIDSD